jgi:hypothetical protein
VVKATPKPLYTQLKAMVPIVEVGWARNGHGVEKNLLPSQKFEPSTVQLIVSQPVSKLNQNKHQLCTG